MRARFLLGAALTAGAVLLAVSPAAAQPYPPGPPTLTASETTVEVGEVVLLTGTNFQPGEEVLITTETAPLAAPMVGLDESTQEQFTMVPASRALPETAGAPERVAGSQLANAPERVAAAPVAPFTVTADGEGGFTTPLRLKEVGITTITATGLESGLSATAVVTVLPDGHKLPKTGSDVWRLVRIGGAGIIAGGVLLLGALAWRARRDRVSA